MGVGPDFRSPYFIVDDRWLVRKPPHLGSGPYSDVERETDLPQWLQHEFFHHLFRTHPRLGLESVPHQWFDRATWPPEFEGRYEADYFHEALYQLYARERSAAAQRAAASARSAARASSRAPHSTTSLRSAQSR